jgi:hypothetical protein
MLTAIAATAAKASRCARRRKAAARLELESNGRNAAPTPTGFAEIVSDDLPILH